MMRVRVIYQGRVQGVGFRWACAAAAEPFKVTGWVRNEPDATVLLEAQGEQRDIDAFLSTVDQRMASNIRNTSIEQIPPHDGETAFRVAR